MQGALTADQIPPPHIAPLSPSKRATLTLWYLINASLSSFDKLIQYFGSAEAAIIAPVDKWRALKIHASHIKRYQDQGATEAYIDEIEDKRKNGCYQLLFQGDDYFPEQLNQLYDPPPLLFARGEVSRLTQAQIAMVGSRKPSAHAQKITFDMAQYLAQAGFIITSGLAMGVDKLAHLGALSVCDADNNMLGRTVGVMGTGIESCYPAQNKPLFEQILNDGGCLISELLPHTPPHKHTFPRRNRLVAGLSLATIVVEAALKSGSLITARLTSEQGKQVFAVPSHIDNKGAEGCHHLIREGATLIYHPQQVIEDVGLQINSAPKTSTHQTPSSTTTPSFDPIAPPNPLTPNHQTSSLAAINQSAPPAAVIDIPEHLQTLYDHIDWHGQDLDALIIVTQLSTPELISQLMALELCGAIYEQGGRYLRV